MQAIGCEGLGEQHSPKKKAHFVAVADGAALSPHTRRVFVNSQKSQVCNGAAKKRAKRLLKNRLAH
jgi:hypothetical protein